MVSYSIHVIVEYNQAGSEIICRQICAEYVWHSLTCLEYVWHRIIVFTVQMFIPTSVEVYKHMCKKLGITCAEYVSHSLTCAEYVWHSLTCAEYVCHMCRKCVTYVQNMCVTLLHLHPLFPVQMFIPTSVEVYKHMCKKLGITCAEYVCHDLKEEVMIIRHRPLGPLEFKALAVALVVCLCAFLSVCFSVCPSICQSVSPSVQMSVCLSQSEVSLCVCLPLQSH